jgi:branched-chain amino acid transport system substrate-binding protein
MRNFLSRPAVFLAAVVALGAILPGPSLRAADAVPYELNMILSTTGPAAVTGVPNSQGVKVLEGMVNAAGGIGGRPVKFTILDDQSSPQVAVQLANGLIAKKVPVILGPMSTASCGAVSALAEKSGPVMYCVSPFIESHVGSFVFAGGPTTEDGAGVVLRYYRERGFTRFAMLNATDASGQALDKAFENAFAAPENKSISIVAHQHFAPGDTSTTAQIAAIKAANPQVLITWMIGAPFATVLRAAHDGGLEIPIVTNGANASAPFMAQLASFLPKEVDFASYPSSLALAANKSIAAAQAAQAKAFEAAHVKEDGNAMGAWDLSLIVIDAMRHLPASASAEDLRAYISKLQNFAGTNTVYDFRAYPQRGIGRDGNVMARYDPATNSFVAISKPGGGK